MSDPRPIHHNREIATKPDPSEPYASYNSHNDDYFDEDYAYNKLMSSKRRSGGGNNGKKSQQQQHVQHYNHLSSSQFQPNSPQLISPPCRIKRNNRLQSADSIESEVSIYSSANNFDNEEQFSMEGDYDDDSNDEGNQKHKLQYNKPGRLHRKYSDPKRILYRHHQHEQTFSKTTAKSRSKEKKEKFRQKDKKLSKRKNKAIDSKHEYLNKYSMLKEDSIEDIYAGDKKPSCLIQPQASPTFPSIESKSSPSIATNTRTFTNQLSPSVRSISYLSSNGSIDQNHHKNNNTDPVHVEIQRAFDQLSNSSTRSATRGKRNRIALQNHELRCKDIPVDKICRREFCEKLYKLSLAKNPLGGIPKKLVLNLYGLRVLNLNECELSSFPKDDWNLPNLIKLDLSYNRLKSFPEENVLNGMPKLEDLNLYNNEISEIVLPFDNDDQSSMKVSVLQNLIKLNVGFNDIENLPRDLPKLKNLKVLNVSENFLRKIPASICTNYGPKQFNLKDINVTANPLEEPPMETCVRGVESMRSYFECLRDEEAKIMEEYMHRKQIYEETKIKEEECEKVGKTLHNEGQRLVHVTSFSSFAEEKEGILDEYKITVNDTLKIIFVGMAEVGKTSIIHRLCYGKEREIPGPDDRTIGVDLHKWDPKKDDRPSLVKSDGNDHISSYTQQSQMSYPTTNTRIEIERTDDALSVESDIDVKFKILDFAGQHVYHATQQLFFSPSALYVIVWDMAATKQKKPKAKQQDDIFSSSFDFDDCDHDEYGMSEEEKKALHDDIDERVQFWVDCIQTSVPGAAILPIGSFSDKFVDEKEANTRCQIMRERLIHNEKRSYEINSQSETSKRSQNIKKDFMRPKLILGKDGDKENIIRVSSSEFTGFRKLQKKIIDVATGRERGRWKYKLFSGHIGARIPRMRLEIRNVVQDLRNKGHIVVNSDFFYNQVKEKGIVNKRDINDALHFLSNVSELAYFGDMKGETFGEEETKNSSRLSKFIFLKPTWLVAAIGCILRHDLTERIKRVHNHRTECIFDNVKNPTITFEDARLLWKPLVEQAMKIMKDAAINTEKIYPYDFLQELLIRFSVFVPIDLQLSKASFDGVELQQKLNQNEHRPDKHDLRFFLPSLLGSVEPGDDFFSYKTDVTISTICNAWLFRDSIPPGIMERIMASSFREIVKKAYIVKEIMCWRNAFYMTVDHEAKGEDGTINTFRIKVFVRMVDTSSRLCVASHKLSPGMKRLTISGQGYSIESCKFIWDGGYRSIKQAIQAVIQEYGGLEYDEHVICPRCLSNFHSRQAMYWDNAIVQNAIQNSEEELLCQNAHRVSTQILSGENLEGRESSFSNLNHISDFTADEDVKVSDLLGGFVLVCAYDSSQKRVMASGSGFIADAKNGLIVSAAHTVMSIEGKDIGKKCGDKILIGVIPQSHSSSPATFRYTAEIIAKDSMIEEEKVCTIDTCILRIVTKLESDINDFKNVDTFAESLMNRKALTKEQLNALQISEDVEVEERVRIIGFCQDGQNLVPTGSDLFRNIGVTFGRVQQHFNINPDVKLKSGDFIPTGEIIINCSTFGGESGGPCINQQGKVIGILSRGHGSRSYLVPSSKWIALLTSYKKRRSNIPINELFA